MSSIKKTTGIIIVAIVIAGIAFSVADQFNSDDSIISVSYTHLTLPTKRIV